MNAAARELNSLLLTAVAPVPFYFTGAIRPLPVFIFHATLATIALATVLTRGPVTHPKLVRFTAYAYLLFFPLNILMARGDLIRPSTNLLFFIAVYLALEQRWSENYGKRLLIAFLLFIAAIATSTHIGVVPFVVLFSFLAFRELIAISHAATLAQLISGERHRHSAPSLRAAAFYVAVCAAGAIVIFPFLPRLGKPVLRGLTPGQERSSTGLGDSIDFSSTTRIAPEADIVARVWMGRDSVPFFTPLRLRGVVYDAFVRGKWVAAPGPMRGAREESGLIPVARPDGFTRTVTIQQQPLPKRRLVLPVGTYAIADIPQVLEEPGGTYSVLGAAEKPVEFRVGIARQVLPMKPETPRTLAYRIQPEVAALTAEVVGAERDPAAMARRIETFLSTRFTYLPDPSQLGRPLSVEEFLLTERRGHCEYFAAGMVVMLSSAGVPARIVGGYYGGELNPLTGYFAVRSLDAHAWVEAWSGDRWLTFDPTPESLRPGANAASLLRLYASALGDSVEFFWDRYILTFGTDEQAVLLTRAIAATAALKKRGAELSTMVQAAITLRLVTLALLLTVLAVLILKWLHQRRRSVFQTMLEQLDRMGIPVDPSSTGAEILEKVEVLRPEISGAVREIVEVHHLERFSGRQVDDGLRLASRRALLAISAAAR